MSVIFTEPAFYRAELGLVFGFELKEDAHEMGLCLSYVSGSDFDMYKVP